jgi:stress-induced-phosphoprotein 1
MPEADDEEALAKKEAETAKKMGNEAYKKRDFEEAATQFSKAWDLWPKDITFLTNLGGELCCFRNKYLAHLNPALYSRVF